MATTLLLRIRESETRAVQKEIEDWEAEQELTESFGATFPQERVLELLSQIQTVIDRQLLKYEEDKHLLSTGLLALMQNKIHNIQNYGESLRKIFENNIEINRNLQELIQTFSSRGYSPNRIEELDLATGDYRRWKEKLLQKWPWLDHEQLKKSFASFERGHFRALKDFLDELQHPANS
ncbi:MAG TPA: hypothetical protein VKI17_08325 [Gemmataceae bacterium]|nr:hypothetical protein [Gemmataceae bacterium]